MSCDRTRFGEHLMSITPAAGGRPRHVRSGRTTVSIVLVASISTLILFASPAKVSAQWKRDWKVQCTWQDQLVFETLTKKLLTYFTDEDAEVLVDWIVAQNCDDSEPGIAWLMRRELRASSYWLEGLDFEPPIIQTYAEDNRKYLAWLSYLKFLSEDDTKAVAIHPNALYFPNGEIYLHPKSVLEEWTAEAHELFHGVQNGSAPGAYQGTNSRRGWDQWVWEGTARGENVIWAVKTGRRWSIEGRYWDSPIYYSDRLNNSEYATALFWLEAGRQLRSRDYIEYLVDVFDEISGQGSGSSDWGSIKALDDTLTDLLKERKLLDPNEHGLQRVFPEFVRYWLWDPNLAERQFLDLDTVELGLPSPNGGGPEHVERRRHNVYTLAANAYDLEVTVPPGRMGGLRVELIPDRTAVAGPGPLHLIVDGRRYNRLRPDGKRNIFATTISGSDEVKSFYVRVANAAGPINLNTETYTLDLNLVSNHAEAKVGGSEAVLVDEGVLFSYVNIARDPADIARSMQTPLLDRYADHGGIPEDTEEGKAARQQIADIAAQELGAPPRPPGAEEGRSSVTDGAECIAVITIFDDESRSVAKMMWQGANPFIGGTHKIKGSFATDVHDWAYPTYKSLGQELTMLEDPEAMSQYMEELRDMMVPGFADALRQAGEDAAAAQVQGVLGGFFKKLPFRKSKEGKNPAVKRGQKDFGRLYEDTGDGILEIERGPEDRIIGHFQYTAAEPKGDRTVTVQGEFVAVPGPLSTDNLWNGCENLLLYPEDNGKPEVEPPIYPPGIDDEDECEDEKSWRECFCEEYPFTPVICIPVFPWPEPTPTPTPDQTVTTTPTVTPSRTVTPTGPTPTVTVTPTGPTPTVTVTPTGPTPTVTVTPTPDDPSPGSGTIGEPGDPGGPGDPGEPGEPDPPTTGDGDKLRKNLILDFLEVGQADLRSVPQAVDGSGSAALVSVSAKRFKLDMVLSDSEIASCDLSQSVRMGLKNMAQGRELKGSIELNATAGSLDLRLRFGQGVIGVEAGVGEVVLSPISPTMVRGNVTGGNLVLDLDQGEFTCEGVMDFSFTLTGDP